MTRSRFIQLDGGQQRDRAPNARTVVLDEESAVLRRRIPFRDLFVENYPDIRRRCLRFSHAGLAIVAVNCNDGRVVGSAWMNGRPDAPTTAIVGRHGNCDLYLDGDHALSLRHLMIVVHPITSWASSDLRFSILDLRSATSFDDEEGRRLEALTAEGPVFVRCGRYALFCCVTGDETDWPQSGQDAWELIPERVFVHEEQAEPDRWKRRRPRRGAQRDLGITHVTSLPGPSSILDGGLSPGEQPVARLTVRTATGELALPVGPRALEQGLLVGRYQRCDALLTNPAISRVHLLLRNVDGRTYAIDTASTFSTSHSVAGTQHAARQFRVVALENGSRLVLGERLAELHWELT